MTDREGGRPKRAPRGPAGGRQSSLDPRTGRGTTAGKGRSDRGGGKGSGSGTHGSRRGNNPPRGKVAAKSTDEPGVHLSDDIVRELSVSARPGKAEILVKVFADAATAFSEGRLDDAIELGDQSKHMALRSTTIREFLGLAYYAAGRWKEAARELTTFRRIAGSTEQNPVIADCYRATDKPEKALEFCDEIDRSKVGDDIFYEGEIVAASALADMDRIDEGISRLERLNLEPAAAEEHHIRAWYVMGDLLQRKGRFTQARKWFQAVLGAEPELTDAEDRLRQLS